MMADERVRWSDDRLDDAFNDIRADVAAHEEAIRYFRSQELSDLRSRVGRAEQAATADRAQAKESQYRRTSVVIAIVVPIFCAAMGGLIALIGSGVI